MAVADVTDGSTLEEVAALVRQGRDAAFGGSLRMMAAVLRQDADAKLAQARELDAYAAEVERGESGPPPPAMRVQMKLAPDEGAAEQKDEAADPDLVQRVKAGGREGSVTLEDDEQAITSPAMRDLLESFSRRWWESPHFVDAVNAAADKGMVADDATARWIADEIKRLEEM